MANTNIQTTKKVIPRCYCYSTPTVADHTGWVKIGYTEQDDVEDRIRQQLQTAHIPHTTEWSDIALFADGRTYFRDSDFHAYMQKQGIERITVTTKTGHKTVTLDRGGVKTNIINRLVSGSTWLTLREGKNRFYLRGTGLQNLKVTIVHTNAYLGV